MALEAATALNRLVQAATAHPVVVGGRAPVSREAQEPTTRPYFRIRHLRMGVPTAVPGRKQGLATLTCHARDEVEAFAFAMALTDALRMHQGPVLGPAAGLESIILQAGWLPAADPKGGAVACSIVYHHFE